MNSSKKNSATKSSTLSVKEIEKKTGNMISKVEEISIRKEEDMVAVKELGQNIAKFESWVKAEKKKQLDPAQATVKAIKEFWAPAEDKIASAKSVLKLKVEKFALGIAKRAEKKEDEIARKVESGEMTYAEGAQKMEAVKDVPTGVRSSDGGGIGVRMIKKVEIVDPLLVPKEYWIIDEVAVRKAALGGVEIPGVIVKEVPNASFHQ